MAIDQNTKVDFLASLNTAASQLGLTLDTPLESKFYIKANKLIIQYNNAGTVSYMHLDLADPGAIWTHTTTAP